MSLDLDETISAQVVLRSATGQTPDEAVEITGDNIGLFVPSPETAARAAEAFQLLEFETGPLVGISFSIAASARRFTEVFGVLLGQTDDGAVVCTHPNGSTGLELPLDNLPLELARMIHAVTFTPPAQLNGP